MVRDSLESPGVRAGVIEWGEYSPWDVVKNAVSSEGERRKVFQDGKAMLGTKVLRILLPGTLGTIAHGIYICFTFILIPLVISAAIKTVIYIRPFVVRLVEN